MAIEADIGALETRGKIFNFLLNCLFFNTLFMQCVIGPILASTTGDVGFGNLFSSANLWYYDSVSYLQTICYTTSSFLISFLIMKKQFKNKEKVHTLNVK